MPFDNMLVVLDLPASSVQELLDGIAASGGWPISHNLSFDISADRTAENIIIRGKALDPAASYRIALPDYVANGGDKAEMLKNFPQENSGVFIRDIVVEHLMELKNAGMPIEVDSSIRIGGQ